MRAVLTCAVLLGFTACKENPSKLDKPFDKHTPDPWSETFGKKDSSEKSGDSSGGLGFDLQGMLEKVKDSIDTPGPYEAPKKTKDFDEEKPHWGVMGVAGGVI